MQCSSCKTLLDQYLEGTLSTREILRVSRHLLDCGECSTLLDELRAVDGLLATIGTPAPALNFTFAVMAEVRSMPVPATRRMNVGALFAGYTIVAWAIIAIWSAVAGITAQSAFENTSSALIAFFEAGRAIANSALGSFGPGGSAVTTFAVGVLGLDLIIALGVLAVYVIVRPRLAAHLASSRPEVS